MNKKLNENEFSPAPGGYSGAINYQTPLNTHSSPEAQPQDDIKKMHFGNNVSSNTEKELPPPEEDIESDIDSIFSKKVVPTSDQIRAALDYELHRMVKPDKAMAKANVVKNLKLDPEYYAKLHQLNIDDEAMTKQIPVNEDFIKQIFTGLVEKKNYKGPVDPRISQIMKDLWEQKQKRRKWQVGDPTL